MNYKNTIIVTAAGLISIVFLVFGLFSNQGTMPSSTNDTQESPNNRNWWTAAPISTETLLVLLAVGIAGALGISRRKKKIKSDGQDAGSDRPTSP